MKQANITLHLAKKEATRKIALFAGILSCLVLAVNF